MYIRTYKLHDQIGVLLMINKPLSLGETEQFEDSTG
jgi:hypothetical protein